MTFHDFLTPHQISQIGMFDISKSGNSIFSKKQFWNLEILLFQKFWFFHVHVPIYDIPHFWFWKCYMWKSRIQENLCCKNIVAFIGYVMLVNKVLGINFFPNWKCFLWDVETPLLYFNWLLLPCCVLIHSYSCCMTKGLWLVLVMYLYNGVILMLCQ